jgi:hypothetical protein
MINSIIVLKSRQQWNHFLINKLNLFFNVEIFYLNENLSQSLEKIKIKLNNIILNKNIQIAFFEGDYLSLINYEFINDIKIKKKVLCLTDDFDMHEVNHITVKSCDMVLTSCPISNLKFQEKGILSFYSPLQADGSINKKIKTTKKYDVLFFGANKADRQYYIDYLIKNKIKIKIISSDNTWTLNDHDLNKLICKSKIVLNFSNQGFKNKHYAYKSIKQNYYILKDRIFISGLSGTLCLSEFAPAQTLLFHPKELPTFKSKEELLRNILYLLSKKNVLKKKTENFCKKVKQYENKIHFKRISLEIINIKTYQNPKIQLPFWYKRIFNRKRINLYSKEKNLLIFLTDVYENIINKIKNLSSTNILLIIETFILTLLLIPKIIIKKLYKHND